MPSENARQAAIKVIDRIEKGEKIVLGEILENIGYAKNTADNPKLVTDTITYKETISTFEDKLKNEIDRVQTALTKKSLDREQYRTLIEALDKLNKNLQLVTGGDTERTTVKISGINYINPNGDNNKTNTETTPSI